jgi:hypothetical protein
VMMIVFYRKKQPLIITIKYCVRLNNLYLCESLFLWYHTDNKTITYSLSNAKNKPSKLSTSKQ